MCWWFRLNWTSSRCWRAAGGKTPKRRPRRWRRLSRGISMRLWRRRWRRAGELPTPWAGRRERLFANAKSREDAADDIVGTNAADELAEGIKRLAQGAGDEFWF